MTPEPDADTAAKIEPRYVSTVQVAKAMGVSVSTVKRWVDDGILPAHRTIGGHRKLLMSDVIRLVREGNLPQADLSQLVPVPTQIDLSDPTAIRNQLFNALQHADAELVRSLIQGGYHHGYPLEVMADQVIGPAMHRIGHDWETGKIQVFQEHRATQTVLAALYELRLQLRTKVTENRPVAIGGAPEHDHSILPSLLAKLVLIDNGWDAINLGPHTPMSAFEAALRTCKPRLVWLSASHLIDQERFLKEYADFYRVTVDLGVSVAIGGSALTNEIRCRMPCTTFGDGLSHLAAFARMLHRSPPLPRRGRPPDESDQ
ncbi:MAG: B12-binding domain-containing protein [Planctomycetes bacterium]|nr:B12-binding domain-containing protein [Planctomycetota bacterium]